MINLEISKDDLISICAFYACRRNMLEQFIVDEKIKSNCDYDFIKSLQKELKQVYSLIDKIHLLLVG